MLWNLIDRRHQHRPTAITSNIKLSAWGKYLGDATVTAAILDRLAMTAVRLDIVGLRVTHPRGRVVHPDVPTRLGR